MELGGCFISHPQKNISKQFIQNEIRGCFISHPQKFSYIRLQEWNFLKQLISFSKAQHGLHSSFKVQFILGFLMVKHNTTSFKNLKDCKSVYLWGNKFIWNQNHFMKNTKGIVFNPSCGRQVAKRMVC
jgi:hypothetical protein